MSAVSADRIEKTVTLRAPRSRVWKALVDATQFGEWFGVKLTGRFAEGATVRGRITHPGYEHVLLEVLVERIEPERYFAYRWHPHAVDAAVDYSTEPMTLVEFTLEDAARGTTLTIVESGFDRLPAARRAEAFPLNDAGWAAQAVRIQQYVERA